MLDPDVHRSEVTRGYIMNSEIKAVLKKTAKNAGVTCLLCAVLRYLPVVLLKALAGEAAYIKDSVKIILDS